MFYRLWNTAKRRPTRALGIAAMTLIIGAIAHNVITDWALHRVVGSPESVEEQIAAIGVLVRVLPAVKLAVIGESVSVVSGLILTVWAGWRTFRRRP